MYCSRCGTQNENASKFCRSCGLDLTATTPVGAVKDPQQEMTDLELVREQLKEEYEILEELGRGGWRSSSRPASANSSATSRSKSCRFLSPSIKSSSSASSGKRAPPPSWSTRTSSRSIASENRAG